MSEEYKAKVFKSGNSLALRLPKALGIEEGTEMSLREEHGKFTFEPVEQPQKTIDVSGFWGKMPGLTVPPREGFEDRPRAWDSPDWPDYSKPK